jgi:hypothetical protein
MITELLDHSVSRTNSFIPPQVWVNFILVLLTWGSRKGWFGSLGLPLHIRSMGWSQVICCSYRISWKSVIIYRVIKKSLCTWWLQYRKLQVMFKVSPASLQTFIDTLNCFLKDRVRYSTFHIWTYSVMVTFNSSVVWGLNTPSFSSHHREKKIGRRKIRRAWRPNGFRNDSVCKHVVQECHRHIALYKP